MGGGQKTSYEIQYTKAADKFFQTHEDVRERYKAAIKELLTGDILKGWTSRESKESGTITTGSGWADTGLCMPSSMARSSWSQRFWLDPAGCLQEDGRAEVKEIRTNCVKLPE